MRQMFLLNPTIFAYDLAILVLLSGALAVATACSVYALRRRARNIWRPFAGFLGIVGFLGFLAVAYGSFVEPRLIVTTRYRVVFPAAQPLKIAVVSDLHLGPFKGQRDTERVVARINSLLPDLVLLAGDYVFTPEADLTGLAPLADIRASMGIFAILGNHDIGRYRNIFGERIQKDDRGDEIEALLEKLGVTVLRNEHVTLAIGDEQIAIAGIDDLWAGRSDLAAALADIPEDTPVILLSHNPSVILEEESHRASLIVAGHTHGGQVRLPWIGPIGSIPTDLGQSYDQGLFRIDDDTTLAITRGIGESTARARLFAWPEVLLLETGGTP